MKRAGLWVLAGFLVFVASSSAWAQMAGAKEAIALIQPSSGSGCKGVVRFFAQDDAVKVVADVEGLAPNARHGFHVHEFGDCSAADATSAGGHYDAAATRHHGQPTDAVRHSGDMGNLQADANGKAHLELVLAGATIEGRSSPLLGRAVIVHANPDDFSQPVGNAGARIGCGVIGVAKPAAK